MPYRPEQRKPVERLSLRCWGIFGEIMRQYIFDGCPVSSQTVAEIYQEHLSPASIRKVMAELEEAGLIVQPHVSAGRIPTDLGYRCYVDRFVGRRELAQEERRAVASVLSPAGEFNEILDAASRLLSELSRHVGIVVAPDLRRMSLRNIEFVRLSRRRVLALFVAESGSVENRVLEMESVPPQEELERFARFLVDEFCGLTLPEMRSALIDRMATDCRDYDRLARSAMKVGLSALESEGDGETEIFVEGTINILSHGEAADLRRMRSLLQALERKEKIVVLLNRCLEQQGGTLIGSESGDRDLEQFSVIATRYRFQGRPLGTLGIIGPVRMEYGRNMALVDHVAGSVSAILAEVFA